MQTNRRRKPKNVFDEKEYILKKTKKLSRTTDYIGQSKAMDSNPSRSLFDMHLNDGYFYRGISF